MNLKSITLSMAVAAAFFASAQNQGYQDGIEYFKADQLDNAKEILEKTLNASETNRAEALYYLGAIALEEGDVATATKYFNEGISLDPKNGFNFVGLGAVDLKNGDAKAAAANFKAATKAQNKAFIHVAIARAYYDADPVAYAKDYVKFMESARKKNLKDPSIYIMQGDKLRDEALASGLDDGETIGQAASEYEQAIHFSPNSPEAYVKYSRVYAHVNPQYAIDRLIELNNIAPNSAMAQRELAERYYDNDKWTLAAQQYGKYIENPNHFVKDEERYAVLLYFGERYDESLAVAKRILAQEPGSVQMKRMLFLNLEKKGDLAGARAAAEKFLATPDVKFTANDYTTYANILHEAGDIEAEAGARRSAAEINPEKADLFKSLSSVYASLGGAAYRAQEIEKANQNYIQSLEAFKLYMEKAGDNASTQDHIDLGGRYQNVATTSPEDSPEREQNITEAIKEIDFAISEAPSHFVPYRNKARMTIVKNNNKPSIETVECYGKMLEMLDADPENKTKRVDTYREAYNQTANYYLGEHDTASAKLWLEKMLELDPENQALIEFIEKLK